MQGKIRLLQDSKRTELAIIQASAHGSWPNYCSQSGGSLPAGPSCNVNHNSGSLFIDTCCIYHGLWNPGFPGPLPREDDGHVVRHPVQQQQQRRGHRAAPRIYKQWRTLEPNTPQVWNMP